MPYIKWAVHRHFGRGYVINSTGVDYGVHNNDDDIENDTSKMYLVL